MPATMLFTIGAVTVWGLAVYWARHLHDKQGYTRAIILATLYCFFSEVLAIRLGKYHYSQFALTLPAAWFSWWVDPPLRWLAAHSFGFVSVMQCVTGGGAPGGPAPPKDVPLEIAMFEAAVLFSIYRISHQLFPSVINAGASLSWVRWAWIAVPMALLNGVLAVNLDAILDPAVSGSQACRLGDPSSPYPGLLWMWHTNADFQGYWFGVPLANYTAWFAALFAFSISVRVGRTVVVGPLKIAMQTHALAFLQALGFLLGLLFTVKFALDQVVYHGLAFATGSMPKGAVWQFAVFGAVLTVSIIIGLMALVRPSTRDPLEWQVIAPQAFSFGYCLVALAVWKVFDRSSWLYPLIAVTAALAIGHAALAMWRRLQLVLSDIQPTIGSDTPDEASVEPTS